MVEDVDVRGELDVVEDALVVFQGASLTTGGIANDARRTDRTGFFFLFCCLGFTCIDWVTGCIVTLVELALCLNKDGGEYLRVEVRRYPYGF